MEKIKTSLIIDKIPKTSKILHDILFPDESLQNLNKSLLIYSVTWNLHGKIPSNEELKSIIPLNKKYDIIIISTQECLRSIAASFLKSEKDEWVKMLNDYLNENYINLANENLSAFHISLFVNKLIRNDFKNVITGKIKTGYLNILANKGAVAIGVKYKKLDLLFINSHLTAGHERIEKRNADFERINKELTFEVYDNSNETNIDNNINNNNMNNNNNIKDIKEIKDINYNLTVSDNFDIIIWSGDFNYRLNSNDINKVISCIQNKEFDYLFDYDQFNNEILNEKIDINGFQEGTICFPPTYKYLENENFRNYDLSERMPGWTDRILYKSKKFTDLLLCKYDCILDTKTSDHKPVFAIFKLDIEDEIEDNLKSKKNKVCEIF